MTREHMQMSEEAQTLALKPYQYQRPLAVEQHGFNPYRDVAFRPPGTCIFSHCKAE